LTTFESEAEQDSWVAEQIAENLAGDELDYDDIFVVLPDARTAKRRATRLAGLLARFDIPSHLAGVGSSVDEVFVPGSVAVAHIHRAKGNEAPMVYVIDAQHATGTMNAVSRRNTIFTAITRSRAWVRICGFGESMAEIEAEVETVRNSGFQLRFEIPTPEALSHLRRIHRERDDEELKSLSRATKSLSELLAALDRGDLDFDDLAPNLRTRLAKLAEDERDAAND
jgi:superfamily I DNA and RNA helicase